MISSQQRSRASLGSRGGILGPSQARRRLSQIVAALIVVLCFVAGLGPRSVAAANPPGFGGSPKVIDPTVRRNLYEFAPVQDEVWNQPISEIRFRGNRRVESEAMVLELDSNVGELVTPEKLARDLKALWALGYFEDVYVEGELSSAGAVLTFVVKERPTIRKIIVEGNVKIKLDDINEVLDIATNAVLELGKVKANVEKIKALYTQGGFFLAEVDYAVRPVEDQPGKVDVVFIVNEAEEVIVRSITFVGNKALTDDQLRKVMITRIGGYLTIVTKKAGGVFNREAFVADYANLRAFYADEGYFDADFEDVELALSPDRRFVHLTLSVEEGPQYRIGGDLGPGADPRRRGAAVPVGDPRRVHRPAAAAWRHRLGRQAPADPRRHRAPLQGQGLRLCQRPAQLSAGPREAPARRRLPDRQGAAGLHRAGQRVRQRPDRRQGHPPRDCLA